MMSNITWIKVWDRFPEENHEVLISDGKFVHEAVLSKDKWWSTDSQNPYNFNNVSYWMEKPEVPTEIPKNESETKKPKGKIIKCDGAIIEELSKNSLMIYDRNGDGMEIGKSPMANLIDEYINHNI